VKTAEHEEPKAVQGEKGNEMHPENGEHEYRAGTSRDGVNYVWGGTWTLPAGTEPRVGLLSLGKQGDGASATSEFDYFRVYRP
jgi:arabinan endo-1,5-alpha-L-arabinosidase